MNGPFLSHRPTIANDIATARRWLKLILRKLDVGKETELVLQTAVAELRALETIECNRATLCREMPR